MSNQRSDHQQLIIEQFTRQAVPFAQMPHQSMDLLLEAAGISADDTVLDVACGPGAVACAFAAVARHVTGIDLTPAMIEQARKLAQARALANVTWRVGDVAPLPFAGGAFSRVFTRYSFHHFLEPAAVLAEMARVCAPDGRVVVVDVFTSTPGQAELYNRMEKLRDPSHVRALSLHELVEIFAGAGLRDVRTEFYKHEFELEQVLAGSFPRPGDDEKIRTMFRQDVGVNALGLGAEYRGDSIYFAYPIVILAGRKG